MHVGGSVFEVMDDFGGTNGIFGDLPNVASRVAIASNDSDARTLAGTGISMEGIDQNPVYCESAPAPPTPPTPARLARPRGRLIPRLLLSR